MRARAEQVIEMSTKQINGENSILLWKRTEKNISNN